MRVLETADGTRIDAAGYSVTVVPDRPVALLRDASGTRWADLALIAQVDTAHGLDFTSGVRIGPVVCEGGRWHVEVEAIGGCWSRKLVRIGGDEELLRLAVHVEGEGDLTDVSLLGGYYDVDRRLGTGLLRSGHAFETVFNPEPSDPARVCRSSREPSQIDVSGGGRGPGSGHWFFTPPPFAFGFSQSLVSDDAPPASSPVGPWLMAGLEAPIEAQTFTALRYDPDERAFTIRLRYEGQTHVAGEFEAPGLVFAFATPDPYTGIRRLAAELRRGGLAPASPTIAAGTRPAWWREPIFCGWGAQFREFSRGDRRTPAPLFARQDLYDGWLARLAEQGLVPGTVVVDDKWQAAYGTCEPDPERWPDLPGWIAARHAAGQRVLLWWKAWDPECLPPEWCVTNATGASIAGDPSSPAYEAHLRSTVRRMLAAPPEGYGADGFKIDFTASTPSGPGLRRHGTAWGVALLHRLLDIVADEARATKPDALLVTHTPNAAFADVTDMIRLNDMDRFDEPDDPAAIVPQMLHRWRVTRAALPDHLVDTDDWGSPTLAIWREFQRLKPGLGVPALYYVDGMDRSAEDFDEGDYETIRRVWAAARATEVRTK